MSPVLRAPAVAMALLAIFVGAGGCGRHSNSTARQDSAAPSSQDTDMVGRRCRDNSGCEPDQYCAFSPGLCGKGKKPGACRPKPASCDEARAPVCGCDGSSYGSECSAHAVGVDLAVMGGCKARLAGYAPCGPHYCDVRTTYCEIFLSDVFEIPTDYFCRPLPPGCLPSEDAAARTCDCFPAGTRCGAFCGPLPTAPGAPDGFHLTCQGQRLPTE